MSGGGTSIAAAARRELGGRLSGRVIAPGDDDMVLSHKQHAASLPFRQPAAVIRCRSEMDVVLALRFVEQRRHAFSVRSGGHCFANLSNAGDVIIDLAELNEVVPEAGGSVRVGPGTLTGDAVRTLAEKHLAIPTGGCALVALGGLALAGGFGFLGRKYGLLADRVESMRVVLSGGRVVSADRNTEPELFWALTGAGTAGFGIVTQMRIKVVPLRSGVACFGIWSIGEAAEVIDLWQRWAPDADPLAGIELSLMAPEYPDEPCYLKLHGVLAGEDAECRTVLSEMALFFGRHADAIEAVELPGSILAEHAAGLRTHDGQEGWLPSRPYRAVGYQATRSEFIDGKLSAATINALIARLQAERVSNQSREVEFIPWRGAYARFNPASCFPHRQARMMLRHTGLSGSQAPSETRAGTARWARESKRAASPDANGHVYSGYADLEIGDHLSAYYGDRAQRLREIKRRYDPDDLFGGPQSVVGSPSLGNA